MSSHPLPPLARVSAIRYVTPLREGGSLPAVMETDDLGTYVVKFRGAGQGPKALVAEVITGQLARGLGLPVPELVTVELDPALAPGEPDQEIQDLLRASAGLNLGIDFLPGSLDFDAARSAVDGELAGQVLWFDALTVNADRSWRNPNMLSWHDDLYLIDHGATLTFQHRWSGAAAAVTRPYDASDHALIGCDPWVDEADAELAARLTPRAGPRGGRRGPGGLDRDRARPGDDRQCPERLRFVDYRPPRGARVMAAGPAGRGGRGRGARMTAAEAFEYAVLRVIPRVDRGEAMNAGIVLYCRPRRYLGVRLALDEGVLLALDPEADVPGVHRALAAMAQVCGEPGAGLAARGWRAQAGAQDIGRRFRWLTAPRSTVVQAGPVHTGLTRDPDAEIDGLLRALVLRSR